MCGATGAIVVSLAAMVRRRAFARRTRRNVVVLRAQATALTRRRVMCVRVQVSFSTVQRIHYDSNVF